jgi:membrane protein YqaA with SNARE-associated domain
MSTVIAIVVAACSLGMLIAYYLGYYAGKREGFESGLDKGKKESAVKAYAVGYDRGKHDREAKKEEEPPARGCFGVIAVLTVLIASLIIALV